MPRLAEPVPARSRGMLPRAAYIFVVVDLTFANPFRTVSLQTFLLLMMARGDHLSMWECENDRGHLKRYNILTETFCFQ